MNKKISLGGAIAFSAIVAAITFIITWIASSNVFDGLMSNVSQRDAIYQKLDEIDKTVRTHYIGDLDEDVYKRQMVSLKIVWLIK